MNAVEIVNLFLETDQLSGSSRTGVYVFGPGLPPAGYSAPDMQQAFRRLEKGNVMPEGGVERRDTLDHLVRMGYTFFIKHEPKNIEVIGKVPAVTTPDGQKLAMQFLGLDQQEAVAHRMTPASSAQRLSVDAVLFGQKAQPQAAKPQAAQQADDMQPLNAPVTLGLTIDLDSRHGIIVREVHPGGPSAQTGIQAGDLIIGCGKFKKAGPYRIHTAQHLERVLRMAGADGTIPLHVKRGDRDYWMPVKPEPRTAT